MPRILTVTLNPCIDQTLTIASFTHGGMNRVTNARRDVAGKGINVSVALKGLGIDSQCAGINFNENGKLIEDYLDGLGIGYDFVDVPGAVRTNTKLFETETRIMTEINQPGAYTGPEALDTLLTKIISAEADIIILSGSRPQGVEADIYRRILEASHAKAVLDTEGEALRNALDGPHKPFLIKPNLFELESAFGVALRTKTETAQFCHTLIQEHPGLALVCVSMGGDGAMLIDREKACFAPALDIPVRGVQGAGDSMVAGMVYGLLKDTDTPDLLRMAVAAASASVVREGTLLCDLDGFNQMLARTKIFDV